MAQRRRRFLLAAAGALTGCDLTGQQPMPWDKFSIAVNRPGMAIGHKLRDLDASKLAIAGEKNVDVLIIGSGAAGLTTAWNLKKAGHKNFAVLAGPEVHGNAAGLSFDNHACPTGAHYLPLPSIESIAMREILQSMGLMSGLFGSQTAAYSKAIGTDGKRAFAVPMAMASKDQQWRQFDSMTFAMWLANEGFHDQHLLAFLDYCC